MQTLIFDTLHRRWRLVVTHPWPWPAVLAVACMLVLLLAFHQVVRAAVQRGALRHAAGALLVEDAWRCKALHSSSERGDCLVALNVASRDGPLR